MNWYTHYIGDYLKDTMHLSLTEDGVYRRLLDNYYATEKPIPSDIEQVFNICRTKHAGDRRAVTSVLGQFFTKTDDGYFHVRVEKELTRSKYISDKRAKAGAWKRNKCSTNQATITPTNTEQSDNTCSTISLSLSQPLNTKPLESVTRAKQATRLPEDFIPKPEHYDIAKEIGANCEMEFAKFRDYYLGVSGARGVKRDWDATLRNWLRNSLNYGGHRATPERQISKAAERQQRNREVLLSTFADDVNPHVGQSHGDDGKGTDASGKPALEGTVRKVSAAGHSGGI